ncbi:MAG: zinc-binding dehydrogenase [Planctomycetota bacterium]
MKTRSIVKTDEKGQLHVVEEPIPELKPYTVLVEVKSCLISPGTELHSILRNRKNPGETPYLDPTGYANAGVVLEVGEGCKGVKKGMRVACMGNDYAHHATHDVVPINLTMPIPEALSFDEASFAHLAATALQAVRRAGLEFGRHVLVVGLGIVGQVAAQLAKASGTHVMAMDRLPMRVEKARALGIDLVLDPPRENLEARAREFTRGYGMDAAIFAFGGDADEVLQGVLKTMKIAPDGHRMGTISIVGGARFEARFPIHFGNMDVRASSRTGPGYHDVAWEHGRDYPKAYFDWTTRRNLEECLRVAAEGRVAYKPLITHHFPLKDAPEAYQALIDRPNEALGVILNP